MKCKLCNRDFNSCSVRECPKTEKATCRYCCTKCDENIYVSAGQECKLLKARDRQ